jgi:transposase InsO family protein
MLLDRDYRWCAEAMLRKFGASALSRAERRAHNLLEDGNPVGRDIWSRVAATIRKIQTNDQAA